MNPEQERQQLNILRDILCQLHVTHVQTTTSLADLLAHLSTIATTLDAIRVSLLHLESSK